MKTYLHEYLRFILVPLMVVTVAVAGCGSPQEGVEAGDCSDAADNDGDGVFDCDDDGCAGSPVCTDGSNNGSPNNGSPDIVIFNNSSTDNSSPNNGSPNNGSTEGIALVSRNDCETRCFAKATECGAPEEAAGDFCFTTLCESVALTSSQAACLESESCTNLEPVFFQQSTTLCGVELFPDDGPVASNTETGDSSDDPPDPATCLEPGESCRSGSDCVGFQCSCDGDPTLVSSVHGCHPKSPNSSEFICPDGNALCDSACEDGQRVSYTESGCWGD